MGRRFYRWDSELRKFVEFKKSKKGHARVYIRGDSMPKTWHPADGKYYDSLSQFRRTTKTFGLVEMGDDDSWRTEPRQWVDIDEEDVAQDLGKVYDALETSNNNTDEALRNLERTDK